MTDASHACTFHQATESSDNLPWRNGVDIATRANIEIMASLSSLVEAALTEGNSSILDQANRLTVDWDGDPVALPKLGQGKLCDALPSIVNLFLQREKPVPVWLQCATALGKIIQLLDRPWQLGYLSIAIAHLDSQRKTSDHRVLAGNPVVLNSRDIRNGNILLERHLENSDWKGPHKFTMAQAYTAAQADTAAEESAKPATEAFWVFTEPNVQPSYCSHHGMVHFALANGKLDLPQPDEAACGVQPPGCVSVDLRPHFTRFCSNFLGHWLPRDAGVRQNFSTAYLDAFRVLLPAGTKDYSTIFSPMAFFSSASRGIHCANVSFGVLGDITVAEANFLNLMCRQMLAGIGQFLDSAVQFRKEIEQRKRYQSLFELTQKPMRQIASSLAEMHQASQELRSLVLEPGEGIFGSRHLVADCFEQGQVIQLNDRLTLHIGHNDGNAHLAGDGLRDDDPQNKLAAQLQLATVILRILGIPTEGREFAGGAHEYLGRVEGTLQDLTKVDRMRSMLSVIALICKCPDNIDNLWPGLGRDRKTAVESLKQLKRVVFEPFKVHTPFWWNIALQAALRSEGISSVGEGEPEYLDLTGYLTPTSYHSVLELAVRLSRWFTAGQSDRKIGNEAFVKFVQHSRSAVIHIGYKSKSPKANHYSILGFERQNDERVRMDIKDLLNKMVTLPRDWRIAGAAFGDSTSHFVEFANRLLNVNKNKQIGWYPVKTKDKELLLKMKHGRFTFSLAAPISRDLASLVIKFSK